MLKISDKPLDVQEALAQAGDAQAGAINFFIGTVRNRSQGKKVVRLEYEAYDKMALAEMQKIVKEAKKRWPVEKAVIHHRKGKLAIGDIAVIIAVSTPHRAESFEACRFMIDTLKQTVPIWKKEIYESGETWVAAHP